MILDIDSDGERTLILRSEADRRAYEEELERFEALKDEKRMELGDWLAEEANDFPDTLIEALPEIEDGMREGLRAMTMLLKCQSDNTALFLLSAHLMNLVAEVEALGSGGVEQ